MGENKLILNGTEYELKECGVGANFNTPFLAFGGKNYVGEAIPKTIPVKEREIISFKNSTGDEIVLHANGRYARRVPGDIIKGNTLKEALTFLHIRSVKRLSDGESFTIGDEVTATIGNTTKPSGKIKEFTIDNGILLVHTEKGICDINWLGKVEYWDKPILSVLEVEQILLGANATANLCPAGEVSKQIRKLAQSKIDSK